METASERSWTGGELASLVKQGENLVESAKNHRSYDQRNVATRAWLDAIDAWLENAPAERTAAIAAASERARAYRLHKKFKTREIDEYVEVAQAMIDALRHAEADTST